MSRRPYLETWKRGDELPAHLQREALARFVHRFTREHKPDWARKPWKDGKPYPVQYASDAEWLARTLFRVTKDGQRFDARAHYCQSGPPTWPDNPELRKEGQG